MRLWIFRRSICYRDHGRDIEGTVPSRFRDERRINVYILHPIWSVDVIRMSVLIKKKKKRKSQNGFTKYNLSRYWILRISVYRRILLHTRRNTIQRARVLIFTLKIQNYSILYVHTDVYDASAECVAHNESAILVWQEINTDSNVEWDFFFRGTVVQFDPTTRTRGQSRSSRVSVIALGRMHDIRVSGKYISGDRSSLVYKDNDVNREWNSLAKSATTQSENERDTVHARSYYWITI